MIYISGDIETTGLDRANDQVLEIGFILEDTEKLLPYEECPKFHAYVQHPRYSGSAFAINMNARIFQILRDDEERNIFPADKVCTAFNKWLYETIGDEGVISAAGKNFVSFDMEFLKRLPDFPLHRIYRRVLDPGEFYLDISKDKVIPDLTQCLNRAGMKATELHSALGDAWDVIRLLRNKYDIIGGKKCFTPEG